MPHDNARRSIGTATSRRALEARSYDPETRSVELVAATSTPVRMPGWRIGISDEWYWEILDMQPRSVDLAAVNAGNCPLLDSHQRWSLEYRLGAVSDARLEGEQLITRAAFGQSQSAKDVEAEVAAGTAPAVSAGYRVLELQLESRKIEGFPVYRATRWELREVSFTPIAADSNAGVRSDQGEIHPCVILETTRMPPEIAARQAEEETVDGVRAETAESGARDVNVNISVRSEPAAPPAAAETPAPAAGGERSAQPVEMTRAEALELQEQARAAGVEDTAAVNEILGRSGITAAEAGRAILAISATQQRSEATPAPAGSAGRVTRDEADTTRSAYIDALTARFTGDAPSEQGRRFAGYSVLQMWGSRAGIDERDPVRIYDQLQERSMNSTSDFPLLMGAAANAVLLAAYNEQEPTYRALARRRSFQDFKPHSFLRVGDFPELLDLGEGGEIKGGSFVESKETAQLETKARLVSLTRQMLINDSLGAFGDFAQGAGRAAARKENAMFYALLASNPTMSDGVAMFHTNHGNLLTAAAIDTASLKLARAALRKQKGLDKQPLNINPKLLLCGPDKETEAEIALTAVTPVDNAKVNPFGGKQTVICDAAIEGNAWYNFADPNTGESNFIYGYLRDQAAPVVRQDQPFNYDGVSFRVIHDFGVGAIDYRFATRNPGA